MKNISIIKIFCIAVFLLLLTLAVTSCTVIVPDSTPDDNNNTGNTNENVDRQDPSAGAYKIRFYLGNTSNYIINYYNEGETIVPPTDIPTYETIRSNYVFDGWDGVEFQTVTGDAMYRSNMKEEFNYYTATFIVEGVEKRVPTICGDYPEVPDISEFQLSEGEQFFTWDRDLYAYTDDVTFKAITVKNFDPEYFRAAYEAKLLTYPSANDKKDNSGSTAHYALALTVLLIEENQNPKGEEVAARIVEHFLSFTSPDQAPNFDASCNWSYAPHTGAIAIAKTTPTVWNQIPDDIKLRLDTMMKAFAMLESFATSDYNDYQTGPGMLGNYRKTWNPNYRLANIPVMVYATHYFGDGDMEAGAEIVNSFLKGFDEAAYEEMIGNFLQYGWNRAYYIWTSEGVRSTDGRTQGKSAKELLISGGQAVGDDTSTASDKKVKLGTGVGVGNGGKDYLYNGYSLSEADGIIRSLLVHNYATGDITKSKPQKSTFNAVKSDHWYIVDGKYQRVAWILGDLKSPYEGQYGMMKEFASGDRSSTSYCSHDFVLTTSMIYTCKILGIYNLATDSYQDKNGVLLREAIIVGNEDFLFKNEKGYQGYATGSYGVSTSTHSEASEAYASYFALKNLWREIMKPELEASLPV